ncbi:VOC family protein [Roseovarius sp. Pro17]|uniref:VOC family protein n=1 Tax=Roseovarius sp. Pro17 TaxID=3108175 RepID=UPI002D767CF1|nr:VOC family protein [Roseovarius sp. Pro17]
MLELDHLAIAARSLEDGCDWVRASMGAVPAPGGRHAHFGTHNCLLGLADGLYLEVIAIDPEAPPLPHARWFDLDRFEGPPRIGNWICRTSDLEATQAALPGIGPQVALSRSDLRWRMAVPQNGQLPFDNCHPAVIQWDCAAHPAASLPDSGIALRRLIVTHPEAQELEARLSTRLADRRVVFETGSVALRAEFDTPGGTRFLG